MFNGALNAGEQSLQVSPGQAINLPLDHQAHPQYAVEWWYLTANLFDQDGNQYPIQWTLFRFRSNDNKNAWHDGNQYMAHAKLMSSQETWFAERFARGGVGNVAAEFDDSGNNFSAYIDDWRWQAKGEDLLPAMLWFNLTDNVSVDLSLHSKQPYVLHGTHGYSIKQASSEHASMYYSQPFIQLNGTLTLPNNVVEVSGQGWFDHEWSARLSDPSTNGWDWFSLHLDDGNKLMIFRVRHPSSSEDWFGSYMTATGDITALKAQDITAKVKKTTLIADKDLPLHWTISVPRFGIALEVTPFKPDQYTDASFSYYEGAVAVHGSHAGVGFIELTGY
ncbi:lipocalin-like domain-containing protein [Aliiglaciecola litoralis]|uniref:Lipocalin-like domain-containing protein n=1 Tax=Aliiglaciecola litoralis TaxID=582857 RepID=A0ABP3WWU3_9ALTE